MPFTSDAEEYSFKIVKKIKLLQKHFIIKLMYYLFFLSILLSIIIIF